MQKIWPVLFYLFPHQAFKDMLYAAQDQAPSIEGKETPCTVDKQTQTPPHIHTYVPTPLGLFGHPQNNSPSSAKNRQSLWTCCRSLHSLWINQTKANYRIITFYLRISPNLLQVIDSTREGESAEKLKVYPSQKVKLLRFGVYCMYRDYKDGLPSGSCLLHITDMILSEMAGSDEWCYSTQQR